MQGLISTASHQWSTRPDDERFTSLDALHLFCSEQRDHSKATVCSSRRLSVVPTDAADMASDLRIHGPNGVGYRPTHWAFGQLATLVGAPAGYLRELPAPMAADCLNYGLLKRDAADVGVLLRRSNEVEFAAATGPNYGRIWNADITRQLTQRFGDGVTGDWRVPGEFGVRLGQVTKANTTLYASDRDMFVFLADEDNRIEVPNTRSGAREPRSLARGFFVWNSETGSKTFGFGSFFFDYVCQNRNIWGARDYKEITIRHTSRAPDRFADEIKPVLRLLHEASPQPIIDTIKAAQAAKVDDLNDFLKSRRFASNMAGKLQAAHMADEGRPIETLWDVSNALTGHARSIGFQDERVALEREAGKVLDLVAA